MPKVNLNWKMTVQFILAIIAVTVCAFFGINHDARVELGECGYATVQSEMIAIHTNCTVAVENGLIPNVGVDHGHGRVMMTIPDGWKWRVRP